MNERIRELAEQAGMPTITATRLGVQATLYDKNLLDVEKFAELIVAECADVAAQVGEGYVQMGYMVPLLCSDKIKEHFGVEE